MMMIRVALAVTSTSSASLPAKKAQTGVAASQITIDTMRRTIIWYLMAQESDCLRRSQALAPALKAAMGCRP